MGIGLLSAVIVYAFVKFELWELAFALGLIWFGAKL